MLLYIETNFIMGAAKRQDHKADDLLKVPANALTIVLPDVCVMEAWATFEREQKAQQSFARDLEQQVIQLSRDLSVSVRNLSNALAQSQVDYVNRLNEAEAHFQATLQTVSNRVEMVALTPAALQRSLVTQSMEKPRDNLILAMIVHHARTHPSPEAALLTGDTEFKSHAEQAGLNYFSRTEAFLGWFSHR